MLFTFIIGLIIFAVSILLGLFALFSAFFKNIGSSASGIFSSMFIIFGSCLFFEGELFLFRVASHVWGIAYLFIIFNAGCIPVFYINLINSAIFTKRSIYKLTRFLTLKKYSYDDVIGYVMKKTSGVAYGRFGARTVLTYDVEIYLKDYKYISFCTNRESNRKIKHIKQLLQDHHCHRNGRIPKKYRSPYIDLS